MHEVPFYINRDRIAFSANNPDISLKYIIKEIRDIKSRYGFNHAHKANLHNLAVVDVKVPINKNGEINLDIQREIASQYELVEHVKDAIFHIRAKILDSVIILDNDEYAIRFYPLTSLFSTVKGLSKYTKKYGNSHSGPYPVYSASSKAQLTSIKENK